MLVSKKQLAEHITDPGEHRGSVCIIDMVEMMRWSKEELVAVHNDFVKRQGAENCSWEQGKGSNGKVSRDVNRGD